MDKPAFGRARPRLPAPPPIPRQCRAAAAPAGLPDEGLDAWKAARPARPFPWKPFLLMAGLCFGVGSLILPASVSDSVGWILYLLSGISFLAGLRQRRNSA